MSLKEVGDSFFNEDMENFIKRQPYMSFVILSGMIEFLGKCFSRRNDFQESNHSKGDYYDVINNLESLQKYKIFNEGDEKEKRNHMYKELRCGMVHALLPKTKIKLTSTDNELRNYTIGARELYSDIKNAWEEIYENDDIKTYIDNTIAIEVYDKVSDVTASNSSVSASTIQ